MVGQAAAISRRVQTRVCVCCGYRGKSIQADLQVTKFRCPNCDADLYSRPPRSYAEMEGLTPIEGSPRVVVSRIEIKALPQFRSRRLTNLFELSLFAAVALTLAVAVISAAAV